MTRRRGRKLVKDRDLAHLTLPTDPEELTPAELAWVRLCLKQLSNPATVREALHTRGPFDTIFADRENGTTGLPRPWFNS